MKRALSKVLAIYILIQYSILLSGCFENTEKDLKIPITKNEPVTLTFYFEQLQPGYENIVSEIENRTRKTLNINLEFIAIGRNLYENEEKLVNMLNNDSSFDVLCLNGNQLNPYNLFASIASNDVLYDITDLFPKYAPNYYSRFSNEDLASVSYNNKIVAVPNYIHKVQRQCIVVRNGLLKKYGFESIDDIEEYEKFLDIISKEQKELTPSYMQIPRTDFFAEIYDYVMCDGYFVYKWNDPDMTLIPWEQTDAYKMAVSTLKRWNSKGFFERKPGNATAILDSHPAALLWEGREESNVAYTDDNRDVWRVFPLSKDQVSSTLPLSFDCFVFNKNSKNIGRALQFIEWVHSSQENYDLLMYGIYGQDYELKEDAVSRHTRYWGNSAFTDFNLERDSIQYASDFKEFYNRNILVNTKYPPHTGFIPSRSLQLEINKRNELFNKQASTFSSGFFNIDINGFIDEQVNSGIDTLKDKYQAELDEWRKVNK